MALIPSHYLYVSNQNISLSALLSVEEEILIRDYSQLITYYYNHNMDRCLNFIRVVIGQDLSIPMVINLAELDQRFEFNLDRFVLYEGRYINSIVRLGAPECMIYRIVNEHINKARIMNVHHYLDSECFLSYPSVYQLLVT